MPRLESMSEMERKIILSWDMPVFDTRPWVDGPPLGQRRVGMVTTAGIHMLEDRPFSMDQMDLYRVIPGDVQTSSLVMSHMATSFDRTGFQRDCNIVFPLDRLREMADEGMIGSMGDFHYSFGTPLSVDQSKNAAKEIADLFKKDKVDAVFLFPV
jgi:D-proline reductase (dithiol) PrdB